MNNAMAGKKKTSFKDTLYTAFNSPKALNIFYLPVLILFCTFLVYPFLKGIQISFTNWDGYSQGFKYIGFDNYKRMFADKDLITVIYNTIIYGVGSTLLQNILGLGFALLLKKSSKLNSVSRTLIYLPAIISPLIMGYIWYFIFQFDGGALNDIIKLLCGHGVDILSNAVASVWIITGVNTFQFVGVSMIIYLAGLQNISQDYYEAAAIDGATSMQCLKNITIPMLAPSITIAVVLNLVGGLKLYDVIWSLTNGGPGYSTCSLSTMMYQLYFGRQDAGLASVLGILMFMMIAITSVIALIVLRKKEIVQ
jgi:raffinose/stachyose/melibiose transport system permease protein